MKVPETRKLPLSRAAGSTSAILVKQGTAIHQLSGVSHPVSSSASAVELPVHTVQPTGELKHQCEESVQIPLTRSEAKRIHTRSERKRTREDVCHEVIALVRRWTWARDAFDLGYK